MIEAFDGFEIKVIQENDAWEICNLMVSNSDRFKRYFPSTLEKNLNPTLSQLFVENKVKKLSNKEEFLFSIKHIETRKIAALIYIKELDWSIKQGEFAYCIDYNFEGQGLTSKAISILSKYAFETLGLERLQIIVHKDNISSVKVALKNSFVWQKTLLNEFTPNGEEPLDMELYELYKQ